MIRVMTFTDTFGSNFREKSAAQVAEAWINETNAEVISISTDRNFTARNFGLVVSDTKTVLTIVAKVGKNYPV